MKLRPGLEQPGFALCDANGEIALETICATDREALELRRQMKVRQPHQPMHDVVAVRITVELVT